MRRTLLALAGLLLPMAASAVNVTDTFTASGTWTAPPGVLSATVEAWGGGGAGGGATANPAKGGGGAGGQYARRVLAVTPGSNYTIAVGAGGVAGTGDGGSGGNSTFAGTSVVARGGAGGTGAASGVGAAGSTTGGVGDVVYAGGSGANASGASGNSGAGGGGAGSGGAGGDASGTTAGAGTANGGGDGGAGRSGRGAGNSGTTYGGGGGGGSANNNANQNGGAGAAGRLLVTYDLPPRVTAISRASANPTGAGMTVSWTVSFSAAVTGVDLTDFVLVQSGGAAGASLASVTGSGTSWTVTANTGSSSSGTLGLNLVDDNSIIDSGSTPLAGNASANGAFTGETYTLTTPFPTLTKTASTAAAVVNDVMTFTITVTNTFGAAMNNVVVTDTLPAGMTYQAHVVSSGSVGVFGNIVTWTIPTLPAGASYQMTLAVELDTQGTLVNSASAPGATTATASVLVLASAVTHFRLDEPAGSYTGAAGEVLDSGGTGLHGRRLTTSTPTTTNTVAPTPTIASQNPSVIGSFCNAARFDGNAVLQVADSPLFDYTTQLSASAWIYPTAYPSSDLYSILSNDTNYEFHLDTGGRLYWWWNAATLTSAATIPLNRWTHIAITMNSAAGARRQRIYINGVADPNTNNWQGTLQANNCNFYIGGDIATGAACSLIPGRNFRGMIDEVKLYAYELNASEVQADMNLGRSCSGTFDHIRIEHDGVASVCAPETVTVKACLDASCSTLYTGNVTVNLSPSGWVGGDSFTFGGGIASRQLSRSTSGNVTLGTVSVTPTPAGGVRCFNGASETCTLNFASASCAFDVAETGGAPQSRLYTKLSAVPFSLDLLALLSPSTINTGYTGTVAVDLVDASSSACPSGSGLTTPTNVTFAAGDSGRKAVSFTYPNAARNVKVRATVGASAPACSNDNFAIRPQSFSVTSSMNNTALTGTPAATAGTAFSLTAAAGVAAGYTGTPALDPTKVNDHAGTAIASSTLSGTFSAGTGSSASGSGFRYLDVGSIQLAANAVVDSGFTAVDQVTDCVVGSASNTLSGGKYGCNVGSVASGKFGRWYPSHYSFAGTLTPACSSGLFSYMGDDALGVSLTLKAHANTGTPIAATDPVTSRYTSGSGVLVAPVTISGDNAGTNVDVARLTNPAFPTMPNSALWNAGLFTINDTFSFSRQAAPDGPYDTFLLRAAVNDADGATLLAPTDTATTRVRYGRLSIANAHGSELLPLTIPVEAQYWHAGGYFATHRDDNCTVIDPSAIIMSGYTNGLAACETRFSPSAAATLANGRTRLTLSAPGAGNAGSVNLALNVGSTPSGKTCLSPTETNAGAANLPGFGAVLPAARATFGAFRTPLIYRRESY